MIPEIDENTLLMFVLHQYEPVPLLILTRHITWMYITFNFIMPIDGAGRQEAVLGFYGNSMSC